MQTGNAGQLVLAWLANVAPHLGEVGATLASPGDAVVGAAGARLEASLTLREREAAAVR